MKLSTTLLIAAAAVAGVALYKLANSDVDTDLGDVELPGLPAPDAGDVVAEQAAE